MVWALKQHVKNRNIKEISNTADLVKIIEKSKKKNYTSKINPCTKTFQALRIFVNKEITELINGIVNATKKLKPGGKIVVVVPCEHIKYKYDPEKDINYHLYSWSPMNLGNLINEAGFDVSECEAYKHKWPPLYIADRVRKHLGRKAFNILCQIYSRIENSWFQVRAVAIKPMDSK